MHRSLWKTFERMRSVLRGGGTANYTRRSGRRLRGIRFSVTTFFAFGSGYTSPCLPNFRGGGDLIVIDDIPSHKQDGCKIAERAGIEFVVASS